MTDTGVEIKDYATKDGWIELKVSKLWTSVDIKAFSHGANAGISTEPVGELIIDVACPGVKAGDHISSGEVADLLREQLSNLFPAAQVFMDAAKLDFEPKEESF